MELSGVLIDDLIYNSYHVIATIRIANPKPYSDIIDLDQGGGSEIHDPEIFEY